MNGRASHEQLVLFEYGRCPCGYEGELREVLEPRPSIRKTVVCPVCLEAVK